MERYDLNVLDTNCYIIKSNFLRQKMVKTKTFFPLIVKPDYSSRQSPVSNSTGCNAVHQAMKGANNLKSNNSNIHTGEKDFQIKLIVKSQKNIILILLQVLVIHGICHLRLVLQSGIYLMI